MRTKHGLLAAILAATAFSCSDNYDSALWETVNEHAERIEALESWQKEMESNLIALQQLVSTHDYITSVETVVEEGKEIGYTIRFGNAEPITIYNGTSAQMSVTKGNDGQWYWTLDGETLTDEDGSPVPANGVTPQTANGTELAEQGVSNDAEGNPISPEAVYVSVDEGNRWHPVAEGGSIFQSVDTTNEDFVIFVLNDGKGTQIVIPRADASLTFELGGNALTDLTEPIDLAEGSLTYTAPEGMEVAVRVLEGEGWTARAENGTVETAPGSIGGKALLEVTLTENGRVVEIYRLTVTQSGLKGSGSKNDPYTVSSAGELAYIAEQVNNSAEEYPYYRKYVQLTQDIDLTGIDWTPIGAYDGWGQYPSFCGTFDGNNHTIKGLKIQKSADTEMAQGLFGSVNSGTIKNLTLESPVVEAGNYVGAVAGTIWFAAIENCHVTNGTVSGTNTTGAVTATNYGGNISDCSVESTTVTTEGYGGGIAGDVNDEYGPASITACRFSGTVATKSGSSSIGGIAGYTNGTDSSIEACYANCTLQVPSGLETWENFVKAGGIVGLPYGSITACYAITELEGTAKVAGGAVGYQVTEGTFGDPIDSEVNACYWSSADIAYGIGGKGKSGSPSSNGATDENATKVTGNDWSAAMTGMNAALAGTGWQYETGAGTFPLDIKAAN